MIDANGQFIDYTGKQSEFKEISFTDIKGHKYEMILSFLWNWE